MGLTPRPYYLHWPGGKRSRRGVSPALIRPARHDNDVMPGVTRIIAALAVAAAQLDHILSDVGWLGDGQPGSNKTGESLEGGAASARAQRVCVPNGCIAENRGGSRVTCHRQSAAAACHP
jgi:hypothetical protein